MTKTTPMVTALPANLVDRRQPSADRARCMRWLPQVSRTFALSIESLTPDLRDAVRTSYLLCRVVDCVEDHDAVDPAVRQAAFSAFDMVLEDDEADPVAFEALARAIPLGGNPGEIELCAQASAVFRSFRELPEAQRDAVRPHILEMSTGMREYAARADARGTLRLADIEDLERYCYFVAGTVGLLLTALFEGSLVDLDPYRREQIRARSVSFGLGLQMVNIVKDVAEDWLRGACFLPESLATKHGGTIEELLKPAFREGGLGVVGDVCGRAREHLEAAVAYTLLWPAHEAAAIRQFCAVPLALALATLREVETGDDTLIPGRTPKVDRSVVASVLAESMLAVRDDEALNALFRRYL